MSETGLPPIAIPIGGDLSGFESSVNSCLRLMDKMADKSMIVAVTINETFGRNMELSFSKSVEKMVARMENGAARMKAALAGVGLAGAGAGAAGMLVPPKTSVPVIVPTVPTSPTIPPAVIPANGVARAAMRGGLMEAGLAGSIIGGASIMGLKSGVGAYREFEGAITESMAIATDATEALRQKARETSLALSKEMGMSAESLAHGIYYLVGGLGTGLNPAIEELSVAAKFARAGMMDLSRASELMVDSQHALRMVTGDVNKDFENATKVTDSLAYASVKYDATLPQMAEAMARGAASGDQMSQSIEDISVVLGEFSNQAIKGEAAGEKYMQLINLLANAYLSKKKVWDQFGMTIFDAMGKALPVPEIIKQFDEVFRGLDDSSKRMAMRQLGIRALLQKPLLILMGRGESMIQARAEMKQSSAGYMDMVFKKQLESPAVQAAIRQQKAMAAMIEIGRKVDGVFASIKNAAIGALEIIAAIPKPMLQILTVGAGMLAVFGGASMLLKPVHVMLVNVGKIMLSFGGLLSKALAPLGAIVGLSGGWAVALGAAVAAAAALAGYFVIFGKMPDFVTKYAAGLKLIFSFVHKNIGAIFEGLTKGLTETLTGMATFLSQLVMQTELGFMALIKAAKLAIKNSKDPIYDDPQYLAMQKKAKEIGGKVTVSTHVLGPWEIMKEVFGGAWSDMKTIGGWVKDGFSTEQIDKSMQGAIKQANDINHAKTAGEAMAAAFSGEMWNSPLNYSKTKEAVSKVEGYDQLKGDLANLFGTGKPKEGEKDNPKVPQPADISDAITRMLDESSGRSNGEFAAVARGSAEAYKAEMSGRAAFEKELLGETKKQTGILGRIDQGIQKVADALGGGDDMEYAAEDV